MPFTVSHAVVALPFSRAAIPAGAVAVGAMAPDLPLFVQFVGPYEATHTLPGMFTIAVPIAAAGYLLWRLLLRPAFPLLVPVAIGERLPAHWAAAARRGGSERRPATIGRVVALAALALAGLVIGVLTHVLWDGLTHPGRFGSEFFPVLDAKIGGYFVARWVQQISTFGGLLVLGIWAVLALRRARPVPLDADRYRVVRVVYWSLLVPCLLAGVATAIAGWGRREGLPERIFDVGKDLAIGTGVPAIVCTIVAAVVVRAIAARVASGDAVSTG